ncbi:T6SS phospholipase effector Tle1-like catalytic domain-containing protein [Aspergillus saccharolyticus JOP 1030-1]|uniref:T6SS Phospholipase effector Tle1-like catalytic domain-containing protein n=1 Tax=Aspergillus saccharolyticus JOP 1030-1 TaxID=1450539 RepID=A0A318ZFQ9_9EURO|nr:hypothetical protein BP01DRAFT_356105 [Aspergillus saccharolyticus JOP 1030-1]PYH45905.1 hypothetical protein BP01DRAFT_356105 [Aspergillus saccharolyticus JOP 1030-1]
MSSESTPSLSLSRPASPDHPTKPLVILCDGTWCGRETNTRSNIYKLAELFGVRIASDIRAPEGVLYLEGVGIGSSFLDYLFNGITGQDIARQCIEIYEYIVYNYTYPTHEIWLFGLSRGSYLARAVAGMINNCGIVHPIPKPSSPTNEIDTHQTRLLCEAVYNLYRSPYAINAPHSPQSLRFRQRKSWPLIGDEDPSHPHTPRFIPPIKFMGLFDTVGSLGIPEYTGGVGLDWPVFYDQHVSTVVENVHHAVSLHDRLFIFQPCLVSRDCRTRHAAQDWEKFGVTRQEWLPGVHYDLGRQRFRFLREFGGGWIESFVGTWFGFASKVIEPNHVLADLALRWMLLAVQTTSTHNQTGGYEVLPGIERAVEQVTRDIRGRARERGRTGDGDVYGNILSYAPFGSVLLDILRTVRGTRRKVSALYQLFFDLRDRLIPDDNAVVYDYCDFDAEIAGCVENLGRVTEERYPSKTYAKWRLRQ